MTDYHPINRVAHKTATFSRLLGVAGAEQTPPENRRTGQFTPRGGVHTPQLGENHHHTSDPAPRAMHAKKKIGYLLFVTNGHLVDRTTRLIPSSLETATTTSVTWVSGDRRGDGMGVAGVPLPAGSEYR